jgi:hypothetical protein
MLPRLKFPFDELGNEILDKFPVDVFKSDKTTFLDPALAGGQIVLLIVNRLKAYGHSDANIASRVWGLAEDIIDLNFAVNKYNIIGTYEVGGIEKLEEWARMGKKFDVIIGNPPYQDPKEKNRKIWKEFVIKSFSILKEDGIFSFITPNNWTANVDNLYKNYFLDKTPLYINLNECARYFPGVSTPFTYYIIKNTQPIDGPLTHIISMDPATKQTSKMDIQLGSVFPDFLPTHVSELIVSILQKTTFSTLPKFPIYRSCVYHTDTRKKGYISEHQSSEYYIPVLYSYANTRAAARYYWARVPNERQQGLRLVIWSRPAAYEKMRVTTDATTEGFFHLAVATQEEGDNAKGALTLKLYKFIITNMTPGLNLLSPVMSNLPAVDLSRSWTNAELYKHFNLTVEEIQLIEDTIK